MSDKPKMKKTNIDPVVVIGGLPIDEREDMRTLDIEIAGVMDGTETSVYKGKFWGGSHQEIIGYGSQTQQRSDKKEVEWFVIGLARQKNYISIYINVVEDGEYLSEKYGADLGKVKVGKSSISFASVEDIDLDKLRLLLIKARNLAAGDG
jgi:hypothetical protein